MKYLLYNKLSMYYDLIDAGKAYKKEVENHFKLIRQYKKSKGSDSSKLLAAPAGTYSIMKRNLPLELT